MKRRAIRIGSLQRIAASAITNGESMSHVTYQIVEHDGGWAYKVDGVFSEPFATHRDALEAARRAAAEQRVPGHSEVIEWEDANGKWHSETASGSDRPETDVKDSA
jgi:hypothetical protein